MVICPIALAVHCTGCPLVKICPVKTILGDFGKTPKESKVAESNDKEKDEPKKASK
jgi:hypothetical protein